MNPPKKSGEERKRSCSKCKRVTWQTYIVNQVLRNEWRCNACGTRTPG